MDAAPRDAFVAVEAAEALDAIEREDAPAPTVIHLPPGLAEPLACSRGNPTTYEREVAEAMLTLAVKDCQAVLRNATPSKPLVANAVSAAGWLYGQTGRMVAEALLGDVGVERCVNLAREVKARLNAL